MVEYVKVIEDLVTPMVDDPSSLSVKIMPSLDENEVLLYVYANSDDVARLIGRKGVMASALRNMMSIASRDDNKRVSIKFESY